MKPESIVFAVAGICFGVILGWVIGAQQSASPGAPAATVAASPAPAAPALDEARVQALMTIVNSDPNNAEAAVQLGNTYFDAEQYTDAITWYTRSLEIDPKNPDASTDLGVSYYYTNQTDLALAQFEQSLAIDPVHTKTLLNKGIVLAFGRQDLDGAAAAWKQVVALAPESPEGQAASRALEGMTAAGHPGGAATPGS
jgi:tetratricopeptide (TPR) repeat protein